MWVSYVVDMLHTSIKGLNTESNQNEENRDTVLFQPTDFSSFSILWSFFVIVAGTRLFINLILAYCVL